MKKRLVALALCFVCILLFSGCSTDEISLISALQKDARMTSVQTTELLSGTMNITLPEEVREDMDVNLQSILNMLSSFRLEATTQQQIKDNTMKAKYNYSILSDDISFAGELYADSDESNQAKLILKIPTPFKALLPYQYENAAYCTLDTADMEAIMEKQEELNRLSAEYFGELYETPVASETEKPNISISAAVTLNDSIFQFVKNYAGLMTDAPELVTKSGNKYSFVMTDKDFKDFIRSMVLTYFDKPEAREEISALWDSIATYCRTIYPDEMMESFPILPELPQDPTMAQNARLQAQLMLALFENVRIIGEDGIRITYTVNSAGFITEMDSDFHLDFDINAITEILTGSADYEEDFAFSIRLHYNQKRQNINNVQTITFPELTEENTFPLYRLSTDSLQEQIDYYKTKLENGETFDNEPKEIWEDGVTLPAADGSITVLYDYGSRNEVIPFGETAPVINENGTLYVPLESFMDWQGIKYSWNEETKMICFQDPLTYKQLQYHPGDSMMQSNDYTINLSAPTLVKDGQDYLPLRAMIAAFTNYKISWKQEQNAAYIRPWYHAE